MTKAEIHENKAKSFIDTTIRNSKYPYNVLMSHLENKIDYWRSERFKLSFINIFELTDEEYNRKNYLSVLIYYAEKILFRSTFKPKKEQIIITGNNLSYSTV